MKCQMSQRCGSCQYLDMDYSQQLIKKQKYCQKLFQKFPVQVHSVIGMQNPFEYRNKVIIAFNQRYEYGLYEEGSHRIVPIQQCMLHVSGNTSYFIKNTIFVKNIELQFTITKDIRGF
ncbi:MAG: hypothetical protein ACLSBH_14290 [Coprobacillus cateniformis]